MAYEDALDDVEILKIQVHDCYSEIAKTADEITSTVHDTYIEKTQLETIQKDFQSSITQNSSEIRMDFTAITDEIKGNVAYNQELLEEYIRFKGALIELGRVGNAFTAGYPMRSLPSRKTVRKSLLSQITAWLLPMLKYETNYLLEMRPEAGSTLFQEQMVISPSNGETLHLKEE